MAVLGLILLVASGVLTAAVVTSNTGAIETNLWGVTITNVSLGVVFVAGMLTTVVGVVGLLLLTGAARRGRRLRQERKALRLENERLNQQVGTGTTDDDTVRSRRWRRSTGPVAGPTTDGTTRTIDGGPVRERDTDAETTPSPADEADRHPAQA